MCQIWSRAGGREMSRNKITMSSYIFDRIQASAVAQDPHFVVDQNKRWLARKDEEDLSLMMDAEVSFLALGAKIFAVSIKTSENRYFGFSGLSVPDQLPSNLEETEATPGLFASAVFCGELQAIATASQARDALEQQYAGQAGYTGHGLAEVMPLFPSIYFVKVIEDVNAPYLENLERVTGTYLAAGYPGHPLEISNNLRLRFVTLFEGGAETIPFSLPLQGLLSYSWSALFLDFYRCLEQLYTTLKLKSLVEKMPHKGSLADLAYLLEDELQWRPREQDALASILELSSSNTRSQILSAFKVDISGLADYSAVKCAKYIYKLRNSHVHFRPAMKAEAKSPEQWNEIMMAMSDAVDEAYEVLGSEFLKSRA